MGSQWQMQRREQFLRLLDEPVQAQVGDFQVSLAVRGESLGVVVDESSLEPGQSPCHGLAELAHADQPDSGVLEGRAVQLWAPTGEATRADVVVTVEDPSDQPDQ